MPNKNIQMPDGSMVAFPDSMADADISAIIRKQSMPTESASVASRPNQTATFSQPREVDIFGNPQGVGLRPGQRVGDMQGNTPVSPKVLNLNPWDFGTYTHEPISYNEYERESGRDIGTVAGAMAGGSLIPKGWGAIGKYLVKPLVSGTGAAIGNVAGGGTPAEAGEAGASTAAGEGLMGGLAVGAKGLLRTGIFGEGLANYFSEATGGKLIPTDEVRNMQRIHEAIGVKPGNMNIGLGATSPADAYNFPARAILKAGFKPQDFEGLNPFQQAEKLKPVWQKAGMAVNEAADKATKAGIKVDVSNKLASTIGDMLDPEGSKALALVEDTADQLGIKDWNMTPNEVVKLRGKLWDRLPARFRGPVYGALAKDLKLAVPEMTGVDTNYTELNQAMEAINDSAEKYMSRASPTKFDQMLELLKQHPAIAGATGLGGTVSGTMGLYQGGKAIYNWMTGR